MLEACGCDHVLTIDIHNESTELAFGVRTGFDSLFSAHTIINYLRRTRDLSNTYIVAPDAGGFKRSLVFAEELGLPVSFLYKSRHAVRTDDDPRLVHHLEHRGEAPVRLAHERAIRGSLPPRRN